jgi:hypothetical protein
MNESPINRAESAPGPPAGYRRVPIGGGRVIVGEDALPFVEAALSRAGTLYDYAARHPEAEPLVGRATVFVVPGPGAGRWLVRRLTHGGLLAPLTRDRFLRVGRPRPFNELLLSHRFRELGIATPRVVAAAVYPSGPIYRGEVAREYVADALDLAACLFADGLDADRRHEALAAAGRLLRSLFDAGVVHRDLNLRNVLVKWSDGAAAAQILDIEKCRVRPTLAEGPRRRMIERFRRSARRFEQRGGRAIGESEWRAFHEALGGS